MDQYQFPCGCEVIDDGKTTLTKRCKEHKAKYPHRLDDQARPAKGARTKEKA